jgi:hypothetical protein
MSDYERIGDEQLRNHTKIRPFVVRVVVRIYCVVEVLSLCELFRRVLVLVFIFELFACANLLRCGSLGGRTLRRSSHYRGKYRFIRDDGGCRSRNCQLVVYGHRY